MCSLSYPLLTDSAELVESTSVTKHFNQFLINQRTCEAGSEQAPA